MAEVLVVYATTYGNTEKMAKAVERGINRVKGVKAILRLPEGVTKEEVLHADALVLGTPVHMGSMDWRIKKFIDDICSGLWMKDLMIGKVGAVFASGSGFGSAGGGCELAMLSMLANLCELGLLFVPLPKNSEGYAEGGLHWGPYARSAGKNLEQTGVSDESLVVAEKHGERIATITKKMQGS